MQGTYGKGGEKEFVEKQRDVNPITGKKTKYPPSAKMRQLYLEQQKLKSDFDLALQDFFNIRLMQALLKIDTEINEKE